LIASEFRIINIGLYHNDVNLKKKLTNIHHTTPPMVHPVTACLIHLDINIFFWGALVGGLYAKDGYMGWSWSGNSGGTESLDITIDFNVNQLSTWGDFLINSTYGIKNTSQSASVYTETTDTDTNTTTDTDTTTTTDTGTATESNTETLKQIPRI
jgi:hypothetical protein